MKIYQKIKVKNLGILNNLVSDYLDDADKLKQLSSYVPELASIEQVLKVKADFNNRKALVAALKNQYKDFVLSENTKQNLISLNNANTYTVCTAHQLCLFTGPSYFIYKILSAIKCAQVCKENFPAYHFVPVYWMGSEDHDFEEINHTYLYNKEIKWENDESGAVGKMLSELSSSIEQLEDILGSSEEALIFITELKACFNQPRTYGKSFQHWILNLFKDYGLIVLNQDDAALKTLFSESIGKELFSNLSSKSLQKNESFLSEHYHVQANARDLNLFYLQNQSRKRIEKDGNQFKVLQTELSFGADEIQQELKSHPEHFSPNVILRPLYQETVLPNVAFIGGPGEVAYWLQLKDVFDAFGVKQPLILLRDMALMMSSNHLTKLEDWKLNLVDLMGDLDQLKKAIVEEESQHELELNTEKESLLQLFTEIKNKVSLVDKNLVQSVDAEQQKVLNSFVNLESKLVRAEKKNFEQKLQQLENIHGKIFPANTFQERRNNFLEYYLKDKDAYFSSILANFNAFNQELKVFEY